MDGTEAAYPQQMNSDVMIYTTRWCPYCIRAKSLLNGKGIVYEEVAVDGKPDARQEMANRAGRTSVPQIWIGATHVGGCDDLFALERRGELDRLLNS